MGDENRCDASAGCGDHVCCLPTGHDGQHESRLYRDPDRSLWASWDDYRGDPEPYACAHEEMEHRPAVQDPRGLVVQCTRCGTRYVQVDDPSGPIHLHDLTTRTSRRIRYEELPR